MHGSDARDERDGAGPATLVKRRASGPRARESAPPASAQARSPTVPQAPPAEAPPGTAPPQPRAPADPAQAEPSVAPAPWVTPQWPRRASGSTRCSTGGLVGRHGSTTTTARRGAVRAPYAPSFGWRWFVSPLGRRPLSITGRGVGTGRGVPATRRTARRGDIMAPTCAGARSTLPRARVRTAPRPFTARFMSTAGERTSAPPRGCGSIRRYGGFHGAGGFHGGGGFHGRGGAAATIADGLRNRPSSTKGLNLGDTCTSRLKGLNADRCTQVRD